MDEGDPKPRAGRKTMGGLGPRRARGGIPIADPDEPTLVGLYPSPVHDDPPTLDEPMGAPPDPRPDVPLAAPLPEDGIEIEVVHLEGRPSMMSGFRPAVEIWTKNRVYVLDATFVCREVRNRDDQQLSPSNPLLGAVLVGGQRRDGGGVELSYPFPRPGTEAVFERPTSRRANLARTSRVVRVVIKQYLIRVAPEQVAGSWSRITGEIQAVDPTGVE